MQPAQALRAVVFDLDGTLVDTVGDLTPALNRTLADLDLPPHSEGAVRGMVGGGLAKLLVRGSPPTVRRLSRRPGKRVGPALPHYAANPAAQSRLYPGVSETLEALRDAGIACGLCTNKPESIARGLLRALGIAEGFGVIQGSDTGFARKPDPAGLAHRGGGARGGARNHDHGRRQRHGPEDGARRWPQRPVLVSYGYS